MKTYKEVPMPQVAPFEMDARHMDHYADVLDRMLYGVSLSHPTRQVVDLYCGRGIYTAASLLLFPEATVHAVDFYAHILSPVLHENERVTFHQGLVVDVLQKPIIPQADLVIIANANRLHGFTDQNIDRLVQKVNGYLLTVGDNRGLEYSLWFRHHFALVNQKIDDDARIWRRIT